MSSKIFIICHDDESEKIAKTYHFGTPIRISNENKYFETQVFRKLEEIKDTWINSKWVGILTYSCHKRLGWDFINHIPEFLRNYQDKAIDVIPLFNLNFEKPRVQRPVPFFESVGFQMGSSCFLGIYIMLKELGYSDCQILDKEIKGFFSNWWICRPNWMLRYIEFSNKCICIAESNDVVKNCLTSDGYYAGNVNPEQLEKIFGQPIYEMTPFLFERLPSFFFGMEKAKILQQGLVMNWQLLD